MTEARSIHSDTVGDPPASPGARIVAVDPRTGIEVLGEVGTATEDSVKIDPVGAGYPPGGFEVGEDGIVEVVAGPAEEPGEDELRRRREWDVVCMCLSGALRNLDDGRLDSVTSAIAEGHL